LGRKPLRLGEALGNATRADRSVVPPIFISWAPARTLGALCPHRVCLILRPRAGRSVPRSLTALRAPPAGPCRVPGNSPRDAARLPHPAVPFHSQCLPCLAAPPPCSHRSRPINSFPYPLSLSPHAAPHPHLPLSPFAPSHREPCIPNAVPAFLPFRVTPPQNPISRQSRSRLVATTRHTHIRPDIRLVSL